MSAVTFHRAFDHGRDVSAQPVSHPRRGFFRRIGDAIALSGQRRAEREIARLLGQSSGRLTDETERRITEHLTRNGKFLP